MLYPGRTRNHNTAPLPQQRSNFSGKLFAVRQPHPHLAVVHLKRFYGTTFMELGSGGHGNVFQPIVELAPQ